MIVESTSYGIISGMALLPQTPRFLTCEYCKITLPTGNSVNRSFRRYCSTDCFQKSRTRNMEIAGQAFKQCRICNEVKSTDEYFRHNGKFDGLTSECKPCHQKLSAEIKRKWRAKNRDRLNEDRRRKREEKRNTARRDAGEYRKAYKLTHNPAVYRRQLERSKLAARALRKEVIEQYGGKCVCCGESEPRFLSIDHTANNGSEHRIAIRQKGSIDRWLKANDFPKEGFQLLCYNCNLSKGFFGQCPHQENKECPQ